MPIVQNYRIMLSQVDDGVTIIALIAFFDKHEVIQKITYVKVIKFTFSPETKVSFAPDRRAGY